MKTKRETTKHNASKKNHTHTHGLSKGQQKDFEKGIFTFLPKRFSHK